MHKIHSTAMFMIAAAVCAGVPISLVHAASSRTTTINDSFHAETVIDARIEDVWPHALETKKWMVVPFDLVTISGTPNTEGEIVKIIPKVITPERAALPKEHYGFYTITKVIPMKQVVIKMYSAKPSSFGKQLLYYSVMTLFDENGKTRVVWDLNGDATGPYMDPAEIQKLAVQQKKINTDKWNASFENLRKIVAQGSNNGK
jgi:hypothetical protein